MVMSGTTQSGLPFTRDDYFKMLQNMYQQPTPQMAGSTNIIDQLRKAGQKLKISAAGTTL